jgi:hypothetical protein
VTTSDTTSPHNLDADEFKDLVAQARLRAKEFTAIAADLLSEAIDRYPDHDWTGLIS